MKRLVGQVKRKGERLAVVGVDRRPRFVPDLPAEGSWVELVHRDDWTVERVLAEPASGLAALYALVIKAGIYPTHTQAVMDEAEAWVAEPGIDDPQLVDLTHLPFVPIDEVTSKDLDQALAIEQRGEGYVVWYALADAAYYVRPGSELFEDSLKRGATYYLPGLTIPMLPTSLSEGIISLNAGEDRRAMVFELHLDARGACTQRRIHRARVHCRHKLDFGGVQAFLDGAQVDWDADVQASLRLLPQVGELRIQRAEERNVVRYRRAEVDVKLHGLVFVALDGPRNDVERYNEQISLLTNVEGARFLREGGTHVEPVYRVHEAPSEERVDELRALTEAVAASHGDTRWAWRDQSLNDWLEHLPQGPIARALHRQAMVINRPSHFASTPGAHFGVGADVYGRYTAPMREVVGIFLHNEVWEELAGAPSPEPYDGPELQARVIQVANQARERQRQFNRQANRLVLDDLFANTPEPVPCTVMGLTPSRVHVQLDRPRVDVKVYVAHLQERWGTELALDGVELKDAQGGVRIRLGDRMRVSVVERDRKRDRWNLALDEG